MLNNGHKNKKKKAGYCDWPYFFYSSVVYYHHSTSLVPTIAFPQHYLNLLSPQILQETLLGYILTNDEKLLCCNCLGARPRVSHATIHL